MWDWLRGILPRRGTKSHGPELLARYQHLRQVGLQLNDRLVATLSKVVLDEGGKKLGILRKNVLILDSEQEIAVLMDYCVHDVRREGANAVERYLAASPPPADSDEMVVLQAMRQARYSLVAVEAVEPGFGVHVRDLLRDQTLFLVDVRLSHTAPVGMILASRIMAHEGITQTTGAALPVGVLAGPERARLLQRLLAAFQGTEFRQLSPEQASEWTATVIRTCLRGGAGERIEYTDPRVGGGRAPGSAGRPPARRVGRNQPCPCGSRKKFKQCCGKRPP